jgi:hypothetical protein
MALACACGCGIFDVGTSSMLPEGKGGSISFEYDFADQDRNWHDTSKAPAEDNEDKQVRTHYYTADLQYMFNRSWGVELAVPYVQRRFSVEGDDGGTATADWSQLGDIRLKGIYTGFSPDLSSGVNFGLKLPTGSHTHTDDAVDVDRDTQIGSGSTDLLLGAFHRDSLTEDGLWKWFAQAQLDVPVLTQDDYRPGVEIDASLGTYYRGLSIGSAKIRPVAQIVGSERTRDSGDNSAHPVMTGYQRVLVAPGLEIDIHPVRIYADIGLPVYTHVTGDQLVAPALVKVVVSYMF